MHPLQQPHLYNDEPNTYAWIIVKDNNADPSYEPPSNMNAVGMCGAHDCTMSPEEIKQGQKFRMSDDGGNIYYYGFINGEDYEGFEPLDDFGMPNAGCVSIEYRNPKTKEYEEL